MNTLRSLVICFILLVTVKVFSQDITSEVKIESQSKNLKEGDVVETLIRFWPVIDGDLAEFKKLEKTDLFGSFYLVKINSLDVSPNNADVVELKGTLIVKSPKISSQHMFQYKGTPIVMNLDGYSIEEVKEKKKDFYVLNQHLNKSSIFKVFLVILMVLVLTGFIKRKKLKEIFNKLVVDNKKNQKKKFNEMFIAAKKREDFEAIYAQKDSWLALLEIETSAHGEYLKILNQHQFKKNWSREDLTEVQSSFDQIRRSFEK